MNSLQKLKINSIIVAVRMFINGRITKAKLNYTLKKIDRRYERRVQESKCDRCDSALTLFENDFCSFCKNEIEKGTMVKGKKV